ncbi:MULTISPECIES: hypothetical protein [Streptococcus]|uniref:Uncharacterized protein n=1 Tax=Streptococcus halitosis TaxID=2172545 RepID=A0A426FUI7_9STRE|nr:MULTISPECIES: hypothetical protein [Streptococcus]EUC80394.1 hypothetical protein HMPREF1518_1107 [Streptococcus sp. SR1]NIB85447.1 hypothetical protein [Streptococcus sp. CCUG 71758]RRN46315.1 hypothetical protein DB729_008900 [Streptococcus halitosis]
MIKITTTELIYLLFEIEQIEAALEYETGFNCYDYFLTDILMMSSEQVLECLNSQKDNPRWLMNRLMDFVSEYFNIQYQYEPTNERNTL